MTARRDRRDSPLAAWRWLPVVAALGVTVASTGLWQALLARERTQAALALDVAAASAAQEIAAQVERTILTLLWLARHSERADAPSPAHRAMDVGLLVRHHPGLEVVAWVDPRARVHWREPASDAPSLLDAAEAATWRVATIEAASERRGVAVSRALDLPDGGRALLAAAPVFRADAVEAFLVAILRPQPLLEPILRNEAARGLVVTVLDGDSVLYRPWDAPPGPLATPAHETRIDLYGSTWRVLVGARPGAAPATASRVPDIVLASGLGLALLVGSAVSLAQTARRRARALDTANAALRFLTDVGPPLASSLEYDETLSSMARLAVPALADLCVVNVLEPDGTIRRAAVAHADPAMEPLAGDLFRHSPDPAAPEGPARVLRTGQAVVYPEMCEGGLAARAAGGPHLDLLERLAPVSSMIVPLVAHGRTLGAISLFSTNPARRFGPDDLRVAGELARRAALALDNALLYREAQAAQQRFRDLVEDLDAVVWEADAATWRFTFVSRRAWALLGYPVDRWLAEDDFWVRALHPDDRDRAVETCRLAMEQGTSADLEYRMVAADGRAVWVRDLVHVVRDAKGRPVRLRGLLTDVTAAKRAAEDLSARARQQAAVAELGQRALAGAEPDALLDEAVALVARTLDVEFTKACAVDPGGGTLRIVAGVGWRPGVVGAFAAPAGTASQAGYAVVAREPVIVADLARETRFEAPALLREHGVVSGVSVLLGGGERPFGVLGAHTARRREFTRDDVHFLQSVANVLAIAIGREEAETALRESEGQLRQAQKMEAVGRLAGGIAHDFNNLMTAVTGYSDLLLRRLGKDEPLARDVAQIRKAGESASALTRQLLAFSRQQVLEPRLVSLNTVVAESEDLLRRLIGEDVDLVTTLAPDLGLVRADPAQLTQVLVNLVVNARDAMPGGGRLTVETADVDLADASARRPVVVRPGRYVVLAVADTGVGMDAETQARAFEPFFTTKEPGKGTGLGLSTVYGIVKQSDGYVWVESEPGRGARFAVYLPRAAAATGARSPAPVEARPSPRGSGTVLVVEDDEGVREVARRFLEQGGYAVLAARDGAEALAVVGAHAGPVAVAVCDVVMPGIRGRDLAARLRAARPDMRVVFMSGYADGTVVREAVAVADAGFLGKPFTADALLRKVREALERPAPETGPAPA